MRMIVTERLADLKEEPQGSRRFFCDGCHREVVLTEKSQQALAQGATICCVPCYKRVVIRGGLGYVSRWRELYQ